jgi:hypothetical protein
LAIREIADELSIPFGVCQVILTHDLGLGCVLEKLVPQFLMQDQTKQHATVCCELLRCAKNDATFFPGIITLHETWFFGYKSETKQILSQWKMQS